MLSPTIGASVNRFLSILGNKVEKVPCLAFPTCDVRDVALAHMYSILNKLINYILKFILLKIKEKQRSFRMPLVIDTF
jgi:hypothetical protein